MWHRVLIAHLLQIGPLPLAGPSSQQKKSQMSVLQCMMQVVALQTKQCHIGGTITAQCLVGHQR